MNNKKWVKKEEEKKMKNRIWIEKHAKSWCIDQCFILGIKKYSKNHLPVTYLSQGNHEWLVPSSHYLLLLFLLKCFVSVPKLLGVCEKCSDKLIHSGNHKEEGKKKKRRDSVWAICRPKTLSSSRDNRC